jgi:hypothetical protein
MIRSRETAEVDLAGYEAKFTATVRDALKEFVSEYAAKRKDLTARSERSIVHDLMVKHARVHFAGLPGVAIYFKRNLFLLGINGAYTIKLKMLDKRLRTRNNVTQLVIKFLEQRLQPTIPGCEHPTNLHLGYKLVDPIELTKSSIYITCPNGKRLEWDWPLAPDEAERAAPIVVPFAPPKTGPLVRPRKSAKQANAQEPDEKTRKGD